MNTKTAYHYTRKFKGHYGGEESPGPLKEILVTDPTYKDLYLRGISHNVKTISKNIFNKKHKQYFDKDIMRYEHKMHKSSIPLYITSKGLVTEEDFFLAEDIMKQIIPIKKRDLIIGMKYKSIVDKEYLYIGNIEGRVSIHFENKIERDFIAKDILLDLKTNKLVYFSNIVLLEEAGLNNKKIELNDKEVFSKMESYFLTVKRQRVYNLKMESFKCDYSGRINV